MIGGHSRGVSRRLRASAAAVAVLAATVLAGQDASALTMSGDVHSAATSNEVFGTTRPNAPLVRAGAPGSHGSRWTDAPRTGTDGGSPFDSAIEALDDFRFRLEVAQGQAAQACAEGIGINTYEAIVPAAPTTRAVSGLFGLEDAERAASFGYLVAVANVDTADDPASRLNADESAAFFDAFFGADPQFVEVTTDDGFPVGGMTLGDGCLRDFYIAFFGDLDRYVRYLELSMLVEYYWAEPQSLVYADPEFLSLIDDWAACMSASGVPIPPGSLGPGALTYGPGAAGISGPDVDSGGSGAWQEPRPSALEIQVAVADVECKRATSFIEVATALLHSHERDVAERISLSELDAELRQIYLSSGTDRG